MEYLTELGYFGLFVSAFLAATILPLSSEVILSALLINDFSPTTLVIVATIGNVLGSLMNYGLGFWLSATVIKKWLKMSDNDFVHAEKRFKKYGLVSLCFAWVPVIGDPLTVIAGMLRINLIWFLLLVTAGKLCRYIVISYLISQTVG